MSVSLPHSYIEQEESIDGKDPTPDLPRVKERKRELAYIMEQLDKSSKFLHKGKNSWSKDPFVAFPEEKSSSLNSMKVISLPHSYIEQEESIDGRDPTSGLP